jgi:hypothetical protein
MLICRFSELHCDQSFEVPVVYLASDMDFAIRNFIMGVLFVCALQEMESQ